MWPKQKLVFLFLWSLTSEQFGCVIQQKFYVLYNFHYITQNLGYILTYNLLISIIPKGYITHKHETQEQIHV